MNQRQTNTILVFLGLLIVSFTGYPVLMGGYRQNGDPFWAFVIISFLVLITWLYYLISEQTCNQVNRSEIFSIHRIWGILWFPLSVVVVMLVAFFLIINYIPGPDTPKDFGIAVIGGLVSGIIVFFMDRGFFQQH